MPSLRLARARSGAHATGTASPVVLALAGPTGPEAVGAVDLHLVDRSREDPWSGSGGPRELMVTVMYPARDTRGYEPRPWLGPGAGRALTARVRAMGATGDFVLPVTHGAEGAPAARRLGRRPVLVHSPGAGEDRSFTTLLAEDLVSWGYVVITVDHPHDSGEVEFPDGRVQRRTLPMDFSRAEEATAVRAADARFVLDHLADLNRGGTPDAAGRRPPPGLRGLPDLGRVGVYGHSLGGAAAAALMRVDRRVRAGVNMDGALFGPVVREGLDRPFLLLQNPVHGGLALDPTWRPFWPRLGEGRRCLELADSRHLAFTDLVALAAGMGFPRGEPLLGTLPADRAVAAVRATVRAFFDLHLRRRPDTTNLLRGASTRHPEIRFIA